MDQTVGEATPMTAEPSSSRGHGRFLAALLPALVIVAGLVVALSAVPPESSGLTGAVPTNPRIEEQWGIRITHVAVTADGGLIDLRFIVLDEDRASALIQDETNIPILIDERNGQIVRSAALMTGKHDVAAGRTSFMLYRNTGGAIHRGDAVTVRFDETLRLDHVPAY